MRIDLNQPPRTQLYRSNSSAEAKKTAQQATVGAVSPANDVVALSSGGTAVQTLRAQMDQVPDIRQQRVSELQQAVRQGSFQVSPDRIAGAMLGE
jgi:negative regulator of flagellin synthesis FlgM